MADRFLIAPYDKNSGVQDDYRPWLIPDEAFSTLTNAYVFRGRVRKRFGSSWLSDDPLLSRFRIDIGALAGGALAGNVRTINVDAGMPTSVGQAFSVGNIVFTVFNPAAGAQQMKRTDNSAAVATYDLGTSAFNITGVALPNGTRVYFYPSFPVMGLADFEQNATNNEVTIGFDTRYAYTYNAGWSRLNAEVTPGAAVWTGSNSQFFWGTTWTDTNAFTKVFFVTNFNNEPNFIRRYNGINWDNFRPQITATPDYLYGCRILVVFKNRLLALNTFEGPGGVGPGDNYPNRCRYSRVGNVFGANSWMQNIPGEGNAIDAATTEAIVTVEFIRDRLIVFFERSTWELVYTGNQAYPFTWQKINTELGAESTFSIVPFDKVAFGVGNVGIHACNGVNVERIDDKIPNTVFEIHNNNAGVERVYGIRDYFVEMVYWSFPDVNTTADFPYPTRVLVYNYKTGTWAFNTDSITCFGYFQPQNGVTWSSTTVTWSDPVSWSSGSLQALFRQVIAGNQEGFTFIVNSEATTNASVLQITNINFVATSADITIRDHNLREGEYIYIERAVYDDAGNYLNDTIFEVRFVTDRHTITIDTGTGIAATYIGGGLVSRVSNINITTKQYNFYAKQGRNASINKIDFMVDKTYLGQIQVNFFASTSVAPLLQDSAGLGVLLGTGTLDTFAYNPLITAGAVVSSLEDSAARVWHPVYFQAEGEVIQFQLTFNDEQMRNDIIREMDFQLHAMCIYAQPTSYGFR